ncbi:SPOR domain-containing protein [Wielerella bovis]|uniref:SPOR domain-containing protein n=1 Tax=Wielerella bovis TaxID=2917790 RepID=UPI002018D9F8|nr:SPOR domain-containing protein [Wielerella bovis]ULJ69786.1 SPOR domain-containing protein [Wielerella bovis]
MMKKYLFAWILGMGFSIANAQDVVIQVGAFADLSLAKQQAEKVRAMNVPVRIYALRMKNDTRLYRVRTAPIMREKAIPIANRLRQNKVEVILVPR